ncbi:MAG TPA: beta-L-arabinofuranosidase domain-containing protein [Fimbriimonadaceae bacterium]|nr:beta-L-arabinofuranosidase domain-containing protein [Fimbriimonadaceae bacterium]
MFAAILFLAAGPGVAAAKPVPFTSVHLQDAFWAPKIEINRTVTIPYAFQKDEETGRVRNFENAAATLRGEDPTGKPLPGYPFDDTDVYKVIEGAAYSLSVHPDPKLDAYVDGLIAKIAAAQEPDGYLYTARTINPKHPHEWSGSERWVNEEEQSHELYDLGHLYEAAAAHYQATGKRNFLDIAIKSANLLDATFGPGKRKIWPGHEIVEMGLAKLYRVTGEVRYLNLAKFMLDCRGGKPNGQYWQADKPVVDQTEAEGHAVRAAYLYSGMADVAALTGDTAYIDAIDKIWDNCVDKKLYITGGIGSTGAGEAFGRNYQLPNMTAYCETCAAVGNDFWNQRLFLLHKDARYVDVLERTLYNGLLSGVGLDGKSFFYPNPLESRGNNERSPWFGCACCPGNITRFMPSIPGYFYAQEGDDLYVNLFAQSTADVVMDSGAKLRIEQKTQYPWDGKIRIVVNPATPEHVAINVRIPGWAREEPVPSDLYRFAQPNKATPALKVNGKPTPIKLDKGYAVLDRTWKKGDTIDLDLPMPVRRIVANGHVSDDRDKVALQRGPILYCAEWPDNPGGKVRNLLLADDAQLKAESRPKLLGGVTVLTGHSEALAFDKEGKIERKTQAFTAIPYYAWANRGKGEMEVWLADREDAAYPTPIPTIASTARLKTSGGTNPSAINNLNEPRFSGDETSFFHWWPKKGTAEWAEYTFPSPTTVSEVQLYWFDDTGRGECRIPESWRILYRDGSEWKPVETSDAYGVEKNKYNRVTFKPVTTTGLRLEVKLQSTWSAGIEQWKVK